MENEQLSSIHKDFAIVFYFLIVNYQFYIFNYFKWYPQGDSNPCRWDENPVS